jgi:peptide/nickel transport system substrate-binding protein
VKNRDYHNPLAVLVAAHEISFKPSVDAVWLDFKSGAIDTYTLLPHQELELEEFLKSEEYAKQAALGGKIGRIDYLQRAYNYVGWNSATPFFSSSRVRRAMTLAIDVGRLIDSNMGGMAEPITGPFFVHSPSYDKNVASLPFDPEEARSLLEEEGWSDRLGQGLRSKMVQGKEMPFRFTLHYFVKNKIAKLNCEMIADNLRQIGVDCRLNGLDVADLTRLFEDKAFDAIYMAWMLSAPPEDPRQLWSSKGAAQKGSSNVVGFIHPLADRIIEDLQYTFGKPERNQLYHRLHALLYQEQPYTFLYSPKSALLYRGWVENLFVPVARPDLIPEADVADPQLQLIRLRSHT